MVSPKYTLLNILKQQLGNQVSEDKLKEVADALATSLSSDEQSEWVDINDFEKELGFNFAGFIECEDICYLASEIKKGSKFRLLKKKTIP
jgi:hypothetical protein